MSQNITHAKHFRLFDKQPYARTIGRMRTLRRVRLGRYFSEGARQLWLHLLKASLTIEDVRRAGNWPRGVPHRWLYGDTCPSLASAVILEKLFGIAATLWRKAPRRPFTIPHIAQSNDVVAERALPA